MPAMSTLVVAVCATLAIVAVPADALTVKVAARETFCFKDTVPKDTPMGFEFKVTAGGKLDINADIYDGSGRLIHGWQLQTEGKYTVHGDATNTRFKFCFSNAMSSFTPKWVDFNTHLGAHPAVATVEHLDPVEQKTIALQHQLEDLQQAQDAMRQLEHDHRNTLEDTNDRVLLWNMIQSGVWIFVGASQIFFMKRFLEVRTSV